MVAVQHRYLRRLRGSHLRASGTGDSKTGTRRTVYRCRAASERPGQGRHASRAADAYVAERVLERLESHAEEILRRLHGGDEHTATLQDRKDRKDGLEARLSEAAGLFATAAITGSQLQQITGELRRQLDRRSRGRHPHLTSPTLSDLATS
jgi:site-specific DNA recombinase